ncbi:MAG: hypothetical protein ACLRQT_10430 [Alistipes sp.]
MKRIILSILSVFITLGAAAETGQALPAVQRPQPAASKKRPPAADRTAPGTDAPERARARRNNIGNRAGTAAPASVRRPRDSRPCRPKAQAPQGAFLPTRRIDREINKLKFAYKAK